MATGVRNWTKVTVGDSLEMERTGRRERCDGSKFKRAWFQNVLLLFEVFSKVYYFPYWKFYMTKITDLWLYKTCCSKYLNRIKSLHDKFNQLLSNLKINLKNQSNWWFWLSQNRYNHSLHRIFPSKEDSFPGLSESISAVWGEILILKGGSGNDAHNLLIFKSCDEGKKKQIFFLFPYPINP